MNNLINRVSDILKKGFKEAGYEEEYGRVSVSNRPDLCEFQCNGAMAAATAYKKAPIQIANEVIEKIKANELKSVEAVMPGFINIKVSEDFLAEVMNEMAAAEKFGLEAPDKVKTIIIDYGGANVAKPLHVGHLRPAIIGESVKRISRYIGHRVIGDAHLGDWGLPMGEVIEEIKNRYPDLPYFDPDFKGEYPTECPVSVSELEEIYPAASARMKQDEEFKERCHKATFLLQKGDKAYTALWKSFLKIARDDLKKNYGNLNVDFDLWNGESDAEPYVKDMLDNMVKSGVAYESRGALVVDIAEPSDKKEYPPCIVRKSDGAENYETTDLATLVERELHYKPDSIIYVVDKRQELHFIQVFRTARKAGIVRPETELVFLGFGTMNGKDGTPFKTRDGGVMRLEMLINNISDAVYKKMMESREEDEETARRNSEIIGLAALKYGDLSNQATKDYCFDIDRFTSFDGNTGPYLLYTIVRIKSILNRYLSENKDFDKKILAPETATAKALMLKISGFTDMVKSAFNETAPHKVCQYAYELADFVNAFYHETRILSESDENKKKGYISLICLARDILETCIDLLGFEAPERM